VSRDSGKSLRRKLLLLWNDYVNGGSSAEGLGITMRRVRFFNIFALVLVIALIIFGAYNLFSSSLSSLRNGRIELLLAGVGIAFLVYARWSKNFERAQDLTLVETILAMTFLTCTGGIERTGIFWWFCLPAGLFYLKGRRAWWWVLGTLGIFGFTILLAASGMVVLPYSFVVIRQFIAAYLVICLLTSAYETIRDEYERLAESRTLEIVSAKNDAEKANKAKSEFLSHMSHELRTPLNSILGFSQLLESDTVEPLTPGQREGVQQILRSGRSLLSLINEVLDLARIEAGRLAISVQPVALIPLVEETVASIRPLAERRRLMLTDGISSGRPLWVAADPGRLKQVLLNLLSNAIKYNRDGGLIRLEAHEVPGSTVAISVSDTGIGIPEHEWPLVFMPFQRLPSSRSKAEGTGIGLAITRELVSMMKGTIRFTSASGAGSCFTVEIPAAGDADEPPPAHLYDTGVAEPSYHGGSVLYIEDDTANLALVRQILMRRPGVRLLHAALGETGIEMARLQSPDLILLDIRLPDMSGVDVLARLRSHPATRQVPIVVVTASAMPHEKAQIQEAGVAGYLTKPIDVPLFLETVDAILAGRTMAGKKAGGVDDDNP
jgi:signal transduction histidine kinase/CheY-like chemotaxis protein